MGPGYPIVPGPIVFEKPLRKETPMRTSFSSPVSVLKGIGIPTIVWTVGEAFDFLNEWPAFRRNAAHILATNACKAALSGEVGVDLAEEAFRGFAKRSGILIEDVPACSSAISERDWANASPAF